MSDANDPRRVIARVPGWSGAEFAIEKQAGGLTNRTYRLKRGKASFILRLDAVHDPDVGLDRDCELEVLERASAAGLAPEIVFSDVEAGILVTRFVEGRPWSRKDLEDPRKLVLIAELLQKVHALPGSRRRYRADSIAAVYSSKLETIPELRAFGERCARIAADSASSGEICCCHNDLVAANIIGDESPTLLDWEYACDNDPLFDLASLVGYHDLDQRLADFLLNAYTGGTKPGHRERLRALIRIYDALHWLWLAVRQAARPDARQARRLTELQRRIS